MTGQQGSKVLTNIGTCMGDVVYCMTPSTVVILNSWYPIFMNLQGHKEARKYIASQGKLQELGIRQNSLLSNLHRSLS